jgi:hypothetical protein
MIIHSLEFYNFLPFHDKQSMHFDVAGRSEQPFTLIIAPTNSGKTTTIRALRFLFYNEINERESIPTFHKLINHRAKLECGNGEAVQSWVRADITWGEGERVIFRRRIEAYRAGRGIDEFRDSVNGLLEIQTLDDRRGNDYEAQPSLQSRIDLFAPRLLFNSFFFAGEPGEGHIDPTRAGTGLAREIEGLFRVGVWDEARRVLLDVQKGLASVEANQNSLQRAVDEAFSASQKALENVNNCKGEILNLNNSIDLCESLRYDLESKLLDQRPKGEAARGYAEEADAWESKYTREANKESTARADAEGLAITDCGTAFILGDLRTVDVQIARLREQDLLPADVSPDFINKLLNRSLKCICDRPLDHSHEEARNAIARHLELSLASKTSSDLQGLAEKLSSTDTPNQFQWEKVIVERVERMRVSLQQMQTSALDAADAAQKEKALRSKVNAADIEEARNLERALHQLKNRLKLETTQLGDRMRLLSSLESSYKNKQKDYQEAKIRLPKSERAATQRREAKSTMIQSALDLLAETEGILRNSLRSSLQERVRVSYDAAATDGSVARIEPNLCPKIYRNGAVVTALGGGQKLMLQLSFVVALAELYNEIRNVFGKLGLVLRNSEHLSIFADAPFAHTAQEYNEAIVEFLAKSPSPQVVLLMHKQQWLAVEALIKGRIRQVFGYRLHSPKNSQSDEYVFEYMTHSTSLLNHIGSGEESFSEIISLPVS